MSKLSTMTVALAVAGTTIFGGTALAQDSGTGIELTPIQETMIDLTQQYNTCMYALANDAQLQADNAAYETAHAAEFKEAEAAARAEYDAEREVWRQAIREYAAVFNHIAERDGYDLHVDSPGRYDAVEAIEEARYFAVRAIVDEVVKSETGLERPARPVRVSDRLDMETPLSAAEDQCADQMYRNMHEAGISEDDFWELESVSEAIGSEEYLRRTAPVLSFDQ